MVSSPDPRLKIRRRIRRTVNAAEKLECELQKLCAALEISDESMPSLHYPQDVLMADAPNITINDPLSSATTEAVSWSLSVHYFL